MVGRLCDTASAWIMYNPTSKRRCRRPGEGSGVLKGKVPFAIKGWVLSRAVQSDKERKADACTLYELSACSGRCVGGGEVQEAQAEQPSLGKGAL